MIKQWAAMICAGLVLASGALAAGVADQIQVQGPYVRAVPPGQENSAAFMVVANGDASAHRLVGARSPAAQAVELHNHINDNGMMRMRRVDGIDLPAGGVATLQPGGLHVMLIGLQQTLVDGGQIDLTLQFEDGSELALQVPVQNAMMQMNRGSAKCGSGKCGGNMGSGGKCGGGR